MSTQSDKQKLNRLKLIKKIWNKLPLSDYWRWELTTIIVGMMPSFIKDGEVMNAYQRELAWQIKKIKPFHGDQFPLLAKQVKEDIYIWAVIDWHYRIQRPQHIAQGLAQRGHRVFYISTSFVSDSRPGFEVESLSEVNNLYTIRLHLKGRPHVSETVTNERHKKNLFNSIKELLKWVNSDRVISIVQYPYWLPAAESLPNSRLIYDCMDYHEGFSTAAADLLGWESKINKRAELIVTTSDFLKNIIEPKNKNVVVIRNACEYDFFSTQPIDIFNDEKKRTIIGYYGAIADWIDISLLEKVAIHFQQCLLLLVGADTCEAKAKLAHLPNVMFVGEVCYENLPFYLYSMDVCLLPFKVIPLTLATNPVKIYEYLSAGKPVVSIELPELVQFGDMVQVATHHNDFIKHIETLIDLSGDSALVEQRKLFASQHTWRHRIDEFEKAFKKLPNPLVSIVIVTYNNIQLTKACLKSVFACAGEEAIEIIVVDNASSDNTPEFLTKWVTEGSGRHIILNDDNRGFSAANNQGLAKASGDYLVLLNNDTEVTPGWLRSLINHLLRDDQIGMIGPVTNNIGNEAKIKLPNKNHDHMLALAKDYTRKHMGEIFPIKTLAFFCVMMRREVYESVGDLDEAYGLGFFEDDDYCRRVEGSGWALVCAEDVFVYHHLSASFDKLGDARRALFDRNRQLYESKWGQWQPHRYR